MSSFIEKLINKKDQRNYNENFYLYNVNDPIWGNRNYLDFAENGYIKNVIAFKCINMIATAAASVCPQLYKITEFGREQIHAHPLNKLLNRPNPSMSGCEFISAIVSYKLIHGNAYALMLRKKSEAPKELYLLRPDRVQVMAGHNSNIPEAYRYSVNNSYKDYKVDKTTGESMVLHLKNFHPLNDWYGMSPIESAWYSIEQHNEASSWMQSLLQNGARPSGALVVKGKKEDGSDNYLNKDTFNRLKDEINEYYMGAANAGRPMLLEGGLEWKDMSLSPKDMDLLNSRYSASRDIALAFGVPPQLLGIPGDNTYSNLAEARISLWEQTVLPMLDDIFQNITSWLSPYFGKDKICISYNKDHINILSEKREQQWDRLSKLNFLTKNEKRRMLGYPAHKDGDDLE